MAEKRDRLLPPADAVVPPVKKKRGWGAEPEMPDGSMSVMGNHSVMGGNQSVIPGMQSMGGMQSMHSAYGQSLSGYAGKLLPGQEGVPRLYLDKLGRELDEYGRIIPIHQANLATFKINQKKKTDESAAMSVGASTVVPGNQSTSGNQSVASTLASNVSGKGKSGITTSVNKQGVAFLHSTRHFDPALKISSAMGRDKRKKGGFSAFIADKDSKYMKEQEQKTKAETEATQKKLLEAKKVDGKTSTVESRSLIAMGTKARRAPPAAIPAAMEWWDALIVTKTGGVNPVLVNSYVEHPVPIKPTLSKQDSQQKQPVPIMTPKERKKLKRMKKQERAEMIRNQIKMGLLEPAPPKIKFSNLMRVMGDEQIANPTEVERKVKAETERRLREHEARNEAAKKNPEERALKKKEKWDGNTLGGPAPKTSDANATIAMTHVLVFDIKDVSEKRHLFKINANAEQFQLYGVFIICPGLSNLLVVEGGERAIRRYKKLILRRIKWGSNDDDDVDDDLVDKTKELSHTTSGAVLMWEGIVQQRQFENYKVHNIKTDAEARKILSAKNCEHYWVMLERFRNGMQVDL